MSMLNIQIFIENNNKTLSSQLSLSHLLFLGQLRQTNNMHHCLYSIVNLNSLINATQLNYQTAYQITLF